MKDDPDFTLKNALQERIPPEPSREEVRAALDARMCEEHREMFEDPPAGGLLVLTHLEIEFTRKAGREYEHIDPGDPWPGLEEVREEHSPVCCWLGDEVLLGIKDRLIDPEGGDP